MCTFRRQGMKKKALICTALVGFVKGFLLNDVHTLQSLGYEVHCAANDRYESADFLAENDVVFHPVEFSSKKPLSRETWNSFQTIKRLLAEEHFDVLHVHTPIPGVVCRVAAQKYRKSGMKVIYTTHGFYFHSGSGRKTWLVYHTIEDAMSRLSDAIITINREDYSAAQKMHSGSVFYIPGVGVDLEKYSSAEGDRCRLRESLGIGPEDFCILSIGELSRRKNQIVVAKALAQCNVPNAVLLLCGRELEESGCKRELEEYCAENHVRVIFAGFRNDIPQVCKAADIGTISSTREGLGLSGIEMLAAGLPVVGSRTHGIVDYIQDGVNGFLADPNRPEEFAGAIEKLWPEATREAFSSGCLESVREFDISRSRKKMAEIYSQLLSAEKET